MKRMNKKGFTLIELLAVIVILGLLMAIAIPSVTKYITQSRKKTLSNTISNYMSALTTEVNNMEYTFTGSNTIYAVPIECIAVERGGTDPFGSWYPAHTGSGGTTTYNSYWAYVLVQYDDATSSYTYGFTFRDSAGYGLLPTASTKLSESGSQIVTGNTFAVSGNKAASLNATLSANANAKVSQLAALPTSTNTAPWAGFKVDTNTKLVMLLSGTAKSDTTCITAQK